MKSLNGWLVAAGVLIGLGCQELAAQPTCSVQNGQVVISGSITYTGGSALEATIEGDSPYAAAQTLGKRSASYLSGIAGDSQTAISSSEGNGDTTYLHWDFRKTGHVHAPSSRSTYFYDVVHTDAWLIGRIAGTSAQSGQTITVNISGSLPLQPGGGVRDIGLYQMYEYPNYIGLTDYPGFTPGTYQLVFFPWVTQKGDIQIPIDTSLGSCTFTIPDAPPSTYSLNMLTNGAGTVSPGSGNYPQGSTLALSATAGAGWIFDYWSGAASGTASNTTLYLGSNLSVTANFAQKLTITGPCEANPGQWVSYSTNVPAGVSGFTWTRNGSKIGYGSQITFQVPADLYGFTLQVRGTDAYGQAWLGRRYIGC